MITPKFQAPSGSFYSDLKSRVNEYFTNSGQDTFGNHKLYTKAVILTVSFVSVYTHLVFFTPHPVLAILECLLLGALTAFIGFNIMHDGAHGSFSKSAKVNKFAGLTLNILGANVMLWATKHNVIHHTYTNIDGVDDDLNAGVFLRLCETQQHKKFHKFQHIYFWVAYSLLFFYWIFYTDYKKYFTQEISGFTVKNFGLKEHISFWIFKSIHLSTFVIIPIVMVGFIPWLIGFVSLGLFAGVILSVVFQLAHTVEATHFYVPNETDHKVELDWALHQIYTTANFATKSKIISWLVGGLNFQVEHHLFPKISHVHYPAINKILKQVCEEYNVKYIEYERMRDALASHIRHLKNMGTRSELALA
jgi:linoleoyl-CoA desaturase